MAKAVAKRGAAVPADVTVRSRARTAARAARAFIEDHIQTGAWEPGARLPTERSLVARFGIARNTLRKELEALEASGRIIRQVGRGTFVAPLHGAAALEDVLMGGAGDASPAEVMELRRLIEPPTASLVVSRASSTEIETMEDCVQRMEEARTVAQFEECDERLHQAIIAATKNRILCRLYDAISVARRQSEWGKLKERSLTAERRRLYQQQHRRIVRALRRRDAEAAALAMREHLAAVTANLFGE